MDNINLGPIIERLSAAEPACRSSSAKHDAVLAQREALVALHERGYSWRAIARELSGSGTAFSADLVRRLCGGQPQRRKPRRSAQAKPPTGVQTTRDVTPTPRPTPEAAAPQTAPQEGATPRLMLKLPPARRIAPGAVK